MENPALTGPKEGLKSPLEGGGVWLPVASLSRRGKNFSTHGMAKPPSTHAGVAAAHGYKAFSLVLDPPDAGPTEIFAFFDRRRGIAAAPGYTRRSNEHKAPD